MTPCPVILLLFERANKMKIYGCKRWYTARDGLDFGWQWYLRWRSFPATSWQQCYATAKGMDHIGLQSKTPSTDWLQLTMCIDRLDWLQHGKSWTISTTGNTVYELPETCFPPAFCISVWTQLATARTTCIRVLKYVRRWTVRFRSEPRYPSSPSVLFIILIFFRVFCRWHQITILNNYKPENS